MNNKGFSLVEALMAVGIMSFILLAINGVLLTGKNIYDRDLVMMDGAQNMRLAMDKIIREVRESSTSTIPNDQNSITFSTPNETGIQYYVSGDQLIREFPSGTNKVIATNIYDVDFYKPNIPTNQLLIVTVTTNVNYYGSTNHLTMIEKVRLRNE